MNTKLKILERIYDLYDSFTDTLNIVCKKNTPNVVWTMLP